MKYWMILLIFSLNVFSFNTSLSYENRLQMVNELAQSFPGYKNFGNSFDTKLGAMAGIYYQTQWQLNTGRVHLRTWNSINSWLTIAPYKIAKNLNCNENNFIQEQAKLDSYAMEVCESWVAYFKLARYKKNPLTDPLKLRKRKLLKLLWRAHGHSIQFALRNYSYEMRNDESEEWYFWANWTAFVFLLEKLNFSTYANIIKPIKSKLMPNCYPLDEGACYYSLGFVKKRYVDLFTRKKISLQKLLNKTNLSQDEISELLRTAE